MCNHRLQWMVWGLVALALAACVGSEQFTTPTPGDPNRRRKMREPLPIHIPPHPST